MEQGKIKIGYIEKPEDQKATDNLCDMPPENCTELTISDLNHG